MLDVDGQAGGDGRTGTPVPGRTVPEVVSQLAWRVLGPYKDRARSVLDWAGLAGHPPGTQSEVARRYGVTSRAVGQRVQRVARAGAALPLDPRVRLELTRPARFGDDVPARQRCAQLLGVTPAPGGPGRRRIPVSPSGKARPGIVRTRRLRALPVTGDPFLWGDRGRVIALKEAGWLGTIRRAACGRARHLVRLSRRGGAPGR